MTGDNLESTFGLDIIPVPTEEEYRLASHQIALNGRSRQDIRDLLQALGYLPYTATVTHRGSGKARIVIRRCNGYLGRRARAKQPA